MVPSSEYEFEVTFPENAELLEASVVQANGHTTLLQVKQPAFKLGNTSIKWSFNISLLNNDKVRLKCRRLGVATEKALTVRCRVGSEMLDTQYPLSQVVDLFELTLSDFGQVPTTFALSVIEVRQNSSLSGLLGGRQSGALSTILEGHKSKAGQGKGNQSSGAIKGILPAREEPRVFSPASGEHYPLWFGTNREGIFSKKKGKRKLEGFSSVRATTVSYGKCFVRIPETHVIGQVESGFWQRVMQTLTGCEDDQALSINAIELQEEQLYWADMKKEAAKWANDGCAVVFLHGYRVSFENAAIRAAQLGCDLKIRGPVGFFSWPSRGKFFTYQADEAAIEASEGAIAQYLQDFAQKCGADRVHVIVHSMGNKGLLRALQRIITTASAGSRKPFDQFILAAPDIDQALFLDLAHQYERLARRTTLYVSNKDLALIFSGFLRAGMARVGLASPVVIADDIDTIHVANVDKTLLGHGYIAEARPVLDDINELIYHNTAPDHRMGLHSVEEGGKRYWVIGA